MRLPAIPAGPAKPAEPAGCPRSKVSRSGAIPHPRKGAAGWQQPTRSPQSATNGFGQNLEHAAAGEGAHLATIEPAPLVAFHAVSYLVMALSLWSVRSLSQARGVLAAVGAMAAIMGLPAADWRTI